MTHLKINVTRGLLEGGRVRNEMDQAASGVPAKECALRSFQDFHPIDIKDCKGLRLRYRDITLIQIYRIGCFDDVVKVILGDTADGELGVLSGEVA